MLAAEAQLRVFRAKYGQAAWFWFPKIETFVTVAGPMPEARLKEPRTDPTQITDASRLYDLNLGQVGVMVRVDASAVVPIFTFGKLTALKEAAEKGVVVGEALRDRARAEAAYQAAEAFYGYQLAREIDSDLTDAAASLADAKKKLQRMIQAQSTQVTPLDVHKVEFVEHDVAARQAEARNGRELAIAALRLLAGVGDGEPFAVADEALVAPAIELRPAHRYVEVAGLARPEVRLAAAGLAARERLVLIHERLFFPDLLLTGLFAFSHTTSADVMVNPFFRDRYNQLDGGVGLTARFTFDVPMKLALLEEAMAERDKTAAERTLLHKAIGLEVRKVVGDLGEALGRFKSHEASERSARRWATGAIGDFDVGLTDTREVIESVAAKAIAGAQKMKAIYDALVAVAALERAIGQDPREVR